MLAIVVNWTQTIEPMQKPEVVELTISSVTFFGLKPRISAVLSDSLSPEPPGHRLSHLDLGMKGSREYQM